MSLTFVCFLKALTADAIGEEEIMAPQIQQHPRKAKQQKLSHLSSPSPKHHKSGNYD